MVRARQPDSLRHSRTVCAEGWTVRHPDGPRVQGGQSAHSWRTVHETLADSPRLPGSFGLDLPCFDSSFRCLFLGSFLEVLSV